MRAQHDKMYDPKRNCCMASRPMKASLLVRTDLVGTGWHGGQPVPEWNSNCCRMSPDFGSHTMAVLSTLPLSSRFPALFHFKEKIGPLCPLKVLISSPVQITLSSNNARAGVYTRLIPCCGVCRHVLTNTQHGSLDIPQADCTACPP